MEKKQYISPESVVSAVVQPTTIICESFTFGAGSAEFAI